MDTVPQQNIELQGVQEELTRAFGKLRNFVHHPPKKLVLGGGVGFINGATMALEKAQEHYDEIPDIQLYIKELASLERTALKMIVGRYMEEFVASPSTIPEGILNQALSLLRDLRKCGEDTQSYIGEIESVSEIILERYLRDFSRYGSHKEIPMTHLFMALDLLVVLKDFGIEVQKYVTKFEGIIPKETFEAALQAKWKDHDRVSSTLRALVDPTSQIIANERGDILGASTPEDTN